MVTGPDDGVDDGDAGGGERLGDGGDGGGIKRCVFKIRNADKLLAVAAHREEEILLTFAHTAHSSKFVSCPS